jgi:phage recombination protein Bet
MGFGERSMSNELMIPDQQILDTIGVDAGTYIALKRSIFPGASDASIHMVVAYCQAANLDLMQKPVHIVPVWSSDQKKMIDVVMPGISLYRTNASRSNSYFGKDEPEFGPEITEKVGGKVVSYPQWCKITVKKLISGQVCEFVAKEFWKENFASTKEGSPNSMWSKRPYGQLAKCTEAQALRMAFPEHVGGHPTAEEMEGKTIDGTCEVVHPPINVVSANLIDQEQAELLTQKAKEAGTSLKEICEPLKIKKLSELNESQWSELCRKLDKEIKRKQKTQALEINQVFDNAESAQSAELVEPA